MDAAGHVCNSYTVHTVLCFRSFCVVARVTWCFALEVVGWLHWSHGALLRRFSGWLQQLTWCLSLLKVFGWSHKCCATGGFVCDDCCV